MVRLKPKVGRVWPNEGEVPETLGVLGQVREAGAFLTMSVFSDSNTRQLKFSLKQRPICTEGFYSFIINDCNATQRVSLCACLPHWTELRRTKALFLVSSQTGSEQ